MPFIKHIPIPEKEKCKHPEHNPPMHIVLPAGIHIYQCPSCGEQVTITKDEVTF